MIDDVTPTALACNLNALTPGQRARRGSLEKGLIQAVRRVVEMPDGFLVEIGDRADLSDQDLREFVELEKRCCPFMEIDFQEGTVSEPRRMRVRGPEGVKDFLRQQFGFGVTGGESR